MRNRVLGLSFVILLLAFALTGCNYVNISVSDISNIEKGKITRSCSYWSGFGSRLLVIEEGESKDINFSIDMEEGEVSFTLKDEDGKEVYTLTKEGKCKETATYTAEKSGTFTLIQKGSRFKGRYEIEWANEKNNNETENDV